MIQSNGSGAIARPLEISGDLSVNTSQISGNSHGKIPQDHENCGLEGFLIMTIEHDKFSSLQSGELLPQKLKAEYLP